MTTDVSVPPTASAPRPATCARCSAPLAVADGRIVPHAQRGSGFGAGFDAMAGVAPGAPCPLSGTIPWRSGTPDEATVRRHLQSHQSNDTRAAHFQVRAMGIFHGIVAAAFESDDETGPVQWGYGFPRDAKGKHAGGIIAMLPAGASEAWAWDFRPFDLHTGEPRVWVDADEAAETRDAVVVLDGVEANPS